MESCPDPVEVSEHSPLHVSCSASPTDSVTWRWLLSNGSASDFQTDTSNTCVMFNVSDITICRSPSKTSFHAATVSRDLFGGASLTCQVGSGVSHSCLIDVIREYPPPTPQPHTLPPSLPIITASCPFFALLCLPKLQALVYGVLHPTTAIGDYAIGLEELSANEQFLDDAQTAVSL